MIITEADYNDTLKLRQAVMYPDKDIDFVKLANDHLGLHIGILEKDQLIAAMSLFIENRSVQFRKLATLPNMQRKGYATILMQWLIDYANDMKLDKLWCNARKETVGFYKKFGYKETENTFTENGHEYVVMELTEFDRKK